MPRLTGRNEGLGRFRIRCLKAWYKDCQRCHGLLGDSVGDFPIILLPAIHMITKILWTADLPPRYMLILSLVPERQIPEHQA